MSSFSNSARPIRRGFVSAAVDEITLEVAGRINDPELRWLFTNCLPNTLDTTVDVRYVDGSRPDTFVITGDIDAMWLRDSTNQVWPYLPYLNRDRHLHDMVVGVMLRQMQCVRLDPYANSFHKDATGVGPWHMDETEMRPGVHERKYELDSLCAVLRLAKGYHENTGNTSWFDHEWMDGLRLILETITLQQEGSTDKPAYRFRRSSIVSTDSLVLEGRGQPARRCGLSKSPFRPSDDAAQLPFLIPANAMAVVCLRDIASIIKNIPDGDGLAKQALELADVIDTGIRENAIMAHRTCGDILAYEVDGYGSFYLMDDANIPSLLSLPYLGYLKHDDPLYQRTRAFVLSDNNPYYFSGKAGAGIGGPHVGLGFIWPMAIIMQALTSRDEAEIVACLRQLKNTHAGTGFMHETFWKDDPSNFTRPWFAWANSLFGELILHLDKNYSGLLARTSF